jgi:hypothetical protein
VRPVLVPTAVLLVALAAGCGGTHFNAAHAGPPAGDVSITSCGLDPSLHTGTVAGTIVNSTAKTEDYVVNIDFVDPRGNRLDSAMHAETGVGAGDRTRFRASGVNTYTEKVGCRVTSVQRTPH